MSRSLLLVLGWALALLPAACHSQDSAEEKRSQPANWATKLADAYPSAELEVYTFTFSKKAKENERTAALLQACKRQAAHILHFCEQGQDRSPGPVAVKIFASVEEKGLALENTQPVQVLWQKPALAIVSSPYFGEAQLGPQNAVLLRRLLEIGRAHV